MEEDSTQDYKRTESRPDGPADPDYYRAHNLRYGQEEVPEEVLEEEDSE